MINEVELSVTGSVVTVRGKGEDGHEKTWSILSEQLVKFLENPPEGVAVLTNGNPPLPPGAVRVQVRVLTQKKTPRTGVAERENAINMQPVPKKYAKGTISSTSYGVGV